MHWPDDEASIVSEDCTETEETDSEGVAGYTECYNLTFAFIPNYQFRYAAGDGNWEDGPGFNDTWSWNFNITVEDQGGYKSYDNAVTGETIDEFGVYSYTEIISVGWPTITGSPNTLAYNDSYITMETRSNGNYSLSVNVSDLVHKANPSYTIDNNTVWTGGGDLELAQFSDTEQWYYGGVGSYHTAENDDTILTTSDIEWAISIPLGQYPGNYNATIYYHLMTET